MKRILLFLLLVIAVAYACKKSQKESSTGDSLAGTWKEQVSPFSRTIASTVTFRADSSYTWWGAVNLVTEQGTYRAHVTSNPKVFNVIFTGTVADKSSDTLTIEMISGNQMSVSHVTPGGTSTRKFGRSQ